MSWDGLQTWLEIRVGDERMARYAETDLEAARLGAWMVANRAMAPALIVRTGADGLDEHVARVLPDPR
jgi:hypothetical protein